MKRVARTGPARLERVWLSRIPRVANVPKPAAAAIQPKAQAIACQDGLVWSAAISTAAAARQSNRKVTLRTILPSSGTMAGLAPAIQ